MRFLTPALSYFCYLILAALPVSRVADSPFSQYSETALQIWVRKVLAFLRDVLEKEVGDSPGGSYGVEISPDGSEFYGGLNGNLSAAHLRPQRHAKGFGLAALAIIHIPHEERK